MDAAAAAAEAAPVAAAAAAEAAPAPALAEEEDCRRCREADCVAWNFAMAAPEAPVMKNKSSMAKTHERFVATMTELNLHLDELRRLRRALNLGVWQLRLGMRA